MPPKQAKKTTAEKPLPCQDGDDAGDTPELDPAIVKVMEAMTANISKLTDNKLDHMLHSINDNISQHLNEISVQFDKAERRISAVEDTAAEVEGSDAVKFMEQWIPRILDVETKADRIKLERAHRIPGPTASKLPRAMIVRFHNFSDRQRVMEAARRKKEVLF
ncbi:hypothetical protein D5F01_LYC19092 [Larimichthys crocea]|uniref:Uncharacterized protein n=1 Tax=Larimichthys crocea TaxID=215358 RepID=A0A6G0HWT2_LARCR|nr:hypothetical protein D5F01_LYC19092 [Larimichthys crocea]